MNVRSRHKAGLAVEVHRTHPWWRYLLARFWKPEIEVKPRVRATISAVVTRADGTVEDKGVVWEGEAHSQGGR